MIRFATAVRAVHLTLLILLAAASVAAVPSARASSDDILNHGKKLYSQFDEELVIRHFFQDRKGGVFVDVGASYWKVDSTTYYLEERLEWSGIAIDAIAEHAAGYALNRPRTKFFSYIVTDRSGGSETLYLAGQLSSTNETHVSDLVDSAASDPRQGEILATGESRDRHVQDVRDVLKAVDGLKDFEPEEIQVETITLNDLLAQNGVTEIDFLSMDIEGGELSALKGFDIERFRPELVCIEMAAARRAELTSYFDAHGYERIQEYVKYDSINGYFRPRDAPTPEN